MTMQMGPSQVRRAGGYGQSARAGWGLSTIRMGGPGQTITIQEARRRIRSLKKGVRNKASEMLKAAGEVLRDEWRENIAGMGWTGTSGFEYLDEEDEDRSGLREEGSSLERSTGRYYNSIAVEVDSDLEVHVGSTIPRPSGRGLRVISYPEALEFGTAVADAYPTLRPALDTAGPAMERKTKEVFDALCDGYLSGKYRADL